MALQLYSLSGSPFGWKVTLALEYLELKYDLSLLSPSRGDLKSDWFRLLNPHGKLPVLVHDDLVLYESEAIIAYLEEVFGNPGHSLWPTGTKDRAYARRASIEAASFLYPHLRVLVNALIARPDGTSAPEISPDAIFDAKGQIGEVLALFRPSVEPGYVFNTHPGAADFSLYPLMGLIKRISSKCPEHDLMGLVPKSLMDWCSRIEALAYFDKTVPPHWKET